MAQLELFDIQREYLDYNTASHLLGVSVATLRNWVKADHIIPAVNATRKPHFQKNDILRLKEKLAKGVIDRLKSRANKRNSNSTFIPKEYLNTSEDYKKIENIIFLLKKDNFPIDTTLLLLSLVAIKKSGLITNDLSSCKTITDINFKNENIKRVISEWWSDFKDLTLDRYSQILTLTLTGQGDFLGIIYQSLLEEGSKAQGGSYYTPSKVVNAIIDQYKNHIFSNTLILDPCCGTGQFILSFSKFVSSPSNIWGYDIDKIAVHIARVNLLLAYPDIDFFPNIYCKNALYANTDIEFDIVATNPPWGYHFSQEDLLDLNQLYPTITSNEAFSYFILKGLSVLKKNGRLTFVLPEAMLKVKQHSDIRKNILNNASILSINHLGNVFLKVLSPVVTISLEKKRGEKNQIKITTQSGNTHIIDQSRFQKNDFHIFDTEITGEDDQIISKIYQRKRSTLANNAEWALGIVTGNNKLFLTDRKKTDNESILKGSDIKKYCFEKPQSFIKFAPEKFQQTAQEWKYRVDEKLIYKFISDKLVFAYDNEQTLTLNSANILIPKLQNYPIKLVLAFLNSILFQYLYKKKFNTIKVLRGDLEKLPFPTIDNITTNQMIGLIDKLIIKDFNNTERENLQLKLDKIIFSIFCLSNLEIEYIKQAVKK